jgi:hypothetical protein
MANVESFGWAVATAIVVPTIIAGLWYLLRRRHYRTFEARQDPALESRRGPGFPDAPGSVSGLTPEVRADHQRASALQNQYQFCLAFAVSALMVGFIGLAGSATLWRESTEFALFSALLDVCCFVLVAIAFVVGGKINRRWIQARIVAELGRQRDALRQLWGDAANIDGAPADAAAAPAQRASSRERLGRAVAASTNLTSLIRGEWKKAREHLARTAQPVSLPEAAGYLHGRPIRQANWFYASAHRLEHQAELRESMLKFCFVVVVLLAAAKVATVFPYDGAPLYPFKYVVSFAIFAFLGVATWLTALFVGQNTRSVLHRYVDQSGRIHAWFDAHIAARTVATQPLSVQAVLEFEDLMIDELVSWVEITRRDRIELSPA